MVITTNPQDKLAPLLWAVVLQKGLKTKPQHSTTGPKFKRGNRATNIYQHTWEMPLKICKPKGFGVRL